MSAYKWLDQRLGGVLPGGEPVSGLAKTISKGPIGRWWDTWIGRRGLIGEYLGGRKADRKARAFRSIDAEIANIQKRKGDIFPDEMAKFNQKNINDWNTLQGSNAGSPLTLATDTGKNTNFQNIINNAINNTNHSLNLSINNAQDRLWRQEDQIADLKAEKLSIKDS